MVRRPGSRGTFSLAKLSRFAVVFAGTASDFHVATLIWDVCDG